MARNRRLTSRQDFQVLPPIGSGFRRAAMCLPAIPHCRPEIHSHTKLFARSVGREIDASDEFVTLSLACSRPCSRNTRSRSRSSTAFRLALTEMQRNFEPMRKQVEAWQRSELTDVTAKVVIYEAFVEGKLEAPKHLARSVHDLYFEPKYEEFRSRTIWSPFKCVHLCIQRTRSPSHNSRLQLS